MLIIIFDTFDRFSLSSILVRYWLCILLGFEYESYCVLAICLLRVDLTSLLSVDGTAFVGFVRLFPVRS